MAIELPPHPPLGTELDTALDTEDAPELLEVTGTPWWLRGGHLETIVPSILHPAITPFPSERRLVEVDPGSSVETWLSRPPTHARRTTSAPGTILLIHGLGGSAQRPHIRAITDTALRRGWHAVRVNLRTHGGTAALASTLFNATQSNDIGEVLRAMDEWDLPRPFGVIAVSLGANMALRYAALQGEASRADAVATLNPALDFFAVEREILRPRNTIYRLNFVAGLCRMLNEVRTLRPVPGPPASRRTIRTVRRFDHLFTAPAAGYPGVDEYYTDAGAGTLLDRIRIPAFILSAANDPFVPPEIMTPHHRAAEGRVRVAIASRGGHVGFRVRDAEGRTRFWAADPLIDWLEAATTTSHTPL